MSAPGLAGPSMAPDAAAYWSEVRRQASGQPQSFRSQLRAMSEPDRKAAVADYVRELRRRQRDALRDFDGRTAEASYPRGFDCDRAALDRAYRCFWGGAAVRCAPSPRSPSFTTAGVSA